MYIGRNYIIITTNPLDMLRIAGELNMVDTGSQWLFLLTTVNTSDSSSSLTVDDNHPEGLAASIREGGNVAFVMNTTKSEQCEVRRTFYVSTFKKKSENPTIIQRFPAQTIL